MSFIKVLLFSAIINFMSISASTTTCTGIDQFSNVVIKCNDKTPLCIHSDHGHPHCTNYEYEFSIFVKKYSKTYLANEYKHKFDVFKNNVDYILSLNQEGNWISGINQYADLTWIEFQNQMTYEDFHNSKHRPLEGDTQPFETESEKSIDWRQKGIVAPIKDQSLDADCGSCWAFSAIGSLESRCALKNNKLQILSEQQLIDCSKDYGNDGCNGGSMNAAYEYIIQSNGVCTSKDYPYMSRDDMSCNVTKKCNLCRITEFLQIEERESELVKALQSGPIAVAIEVQKSFQFYKNAVYQQPRNCGYKLNHGVVIVGYTPDYWIVKNSWGTSWGMSGYAYMVRNANVCGINRSACYPLLA